MPSSPTAYTGFIDEITPDGRIVGWACRPGHVERLHVAIHAEGRLIAEAVTDRFRADLLAAGFGLGHCAFSARWHAPLPPGEHHLQMTLPAHGAEPRGFTLAVPPPPPADAAPPADREAQWCAEDVLDHIVHLRLDEQYAALGLERFVDGAYRFALDRWPEPPRLAELRAAAAAGHFSPEECLAEALQSEERRAGADRPLLSPFDYRFPFRYPPRA